MESNQDSFYTIADSEKYQKYKKFEFLYKTKGINIVTTTEKLIKLIATLRDKKLYAIDTETTGLDVHSCDLVGIGFCWGLGLGESAYIPVGHKEGEQLHIDDVLLLLKPLLESDYTQKILHNAKYDINVLRAYGIRLKGLYFDTIVAHYILRTNHYSETYGRYSNHKLDIVIIDYFPIYPYSYSAVVPKGGTLAEVCIEDVAYYCAIDCWCTFGLYTKLSPLINGSTIEYLYYAVEVSLVPILADMEYRGLCMNDNWYIHKKETIKPQLDAIAKVASTYKEGINLNSPIQLSKFIFEELKLPTKGVLKNKQSYSIDKNTIALLKGTHPFIEVLAEHKSIVHLYNTFVEGIYKKKNTVTNRLHPNFNQVSTDTGRLSCLDPNAQNFPPQYREGIVPREGYSFISFDYSQCELRILAYLSQEPVLIQAFLNNEDVHVTVAQILLGKKDISKEERRAAKTLNFGIIYGMQEFKLAASLGCTIPQALKLKNDYWEKLPMVRLWFEKIYRQAIGNGYTETIMGRRRYYNFMMPLLKSCRGIDYKLLPNFNSLLGKYTLWEHDAEVLRSAGNAPIQGSNADITKLAMVNCNTLLHKYDCYILLSIHDEIIFECVNEQVDRVITPIKKVMESAYNLGVPLLVDHRVGKSWKECK